MKNIILFLTLITTISLTANPLEYKYRYSGVIQEKATQKYFYAKRAAQRGNAQAQYDLGLMYATGNGVVKNEALALMWFTRASENNFSKTAPVKKVVNMRKKVVMTRSVEGVSQKFMFARNAAARGNSRAQFDLAMMYRNGEGVRKNDLLAFNYFHKAARNNSVEAKFQMGLSFAQGKGVRKHMQLAKYWFKLAAKAGHSKAMGHLASLEKRTRPKYGRRSRVTSLSFSKPVSVREF